MSDGPSTGELKLEQLRREAVERAQAETAELEDDTDQHERRADKAAYLREKLAERERSEREANGEE